VFADIPEQQKLKETLAHRSRMVGQWQARTAKSNKAEEHAGADREGVPASTLPAVI
jgi:hypothetical protein